MRELIAKNAKQLDRCLRLLYAEHVHFTVEVVETKQRKIVYSVKVNAEERIAAIVSEKYRIMIS